MKLNLTKANIARYVTSVSLVLISLALIFWSQIAPSIPLTLPQVAGIGLGFLVGAFLYFDHLISQLITNPSTTIVHATLNKCFDLIESKMGHVNHLRIYANATSNIQPLFANSRLTVERCEILLRELPKDEVDAELNIHIARMIKQWEELKIKGRIKQLECRRHHAIPTEWQVIFDDRFIISGLNIPEKNDWLGIDILEPTKIDNRSMETKLLINKYIERFDGFFRIAAEPTIAPNKSLDRSAEQRGSQVTLSGLVES
jgi:hypothetical protein